MSTAETTPAVPSSRVIDRLRQEPARARRALLADFVQEQLGYAIGIDKADIGPTDRLMDLGIDSVKAIEVKLYLEEELGLELSSALLFDYPTLDRLVDFLLETTHLGGASAGAAPSAPQPAPAPGQASGADPDDVPDYLPKERLAELLAAELAAIKRLHDGGAK